VAALSRVLGIGSPNSVRIATLPAFAALGLGLRLSRLQLDPNNKTLLKPKTRAILGK